MDFEERRNNLVNKLKREGRIYTKEVEKAFLEVPRELFVPKHLINYAYVDSPLEIGSGQTISAPHMVAIMVEALCIQKGQKILEIGAGSGYHAAIVSKLIGNKGQIYTIERYEKLVKFAKQNLQNADVKNVIVKKGDGSIGLSKHAPYDRIYVTCAAPSIPEPLINQIKDNGKMLIPIGYTICELELIEKKDKDIITKHLGGCAFVPLIGKYGH